MISNFTRNASRSTTYSLLFTAMSANVDREVAKFSNPIFPKIHPFKYNYNLTGYSCFLYFYSPASSATYILDTSFSDVYEMI